MTDRIFTGAEKNFEDIVNENKLIVYSTVMAALYNSAEVDDIVQETFIYAYYNYQTLREKNKLTSWLCTIARNKAKKVNKIYGKTIYLNDLSDLLTDSPAENTVMEMYRKAEIMREVGKLSDVLRETILLYYIAEKSTREIAEIFSIPEGTVRFRLSEGRKKLKKELMKIMSTEKRIIESNELYEKVKADIISLDNFEISLQNHELKLNDKAVDIPSKELELLYFLASNSNCVFNRDQLIDKVWNSDFHDDSRMVDVFIKRLREKLDGVSDKWGIKTVWGEGYKFELA